MGLNLGRYLLIPNYFPFKGLTKFSPLGRPRLRTVWRFYYWRIRQRFLRLFSQQFSYKTGEIFPPDIYFYLFPLVALFFYALAFTVIVCLDRLF